VANDNETEILIRAKNITEQAFKEVSAALKALGDQQRKVTDEGKAQWSGLYEKLSGSQAIAGANASGEGCCGRRRRFEIDGRRASAREYRRDGSPRRNIRR
jgi:hypothetical protein